MTNNTNVNTNTNAITITKLITALEDSFDYLNTRFYDGELSRPVITIAEGAKVRAYGWFVCKEVWHEGEKSACELNISSDYLNRNFGDIVNTLMHEMVHCSNYANGVQDCARAGQRHNKKFAEEAEKRGMVWIKPEENDEKGQDYYKKYGYANVKIKEELKDEILNALNFLKDALTIYRDKTEKNTRKKAVSNVIKYICPCCNASCRATKEINIICADCEEAMIAE